MQKHIGFTRLAAITLSVFASGIVGGVAGALQADAGTVLIGGGSANGVYYQAVQHICGVLNRSAGGEFKCLGSATLGSVFNINAVSMGLLDFGIAQSDRHWQATQGGGDWRETGPLEKLRSVVSLHSEPVFLVARRDSGIASVADLRGKRVNIGNPGSGQRGNAEDVLKIYGIDKERDLRAESLQQDDASRALIDGKIDAFFFTVGSPSNAIQGPAEAIDIRIIPIDSPAIRRFIADKSYYTMVTVPAGAYRGMDEAIETFAVRATLVTRADVPADLVYRVVQTFFGHLDEMKRAHPVFQALDPRDLLDGLAAPLHPGARRYYLEKGLVGTRSPR